MVGLQALTRYAAGAKPTWTPRSPCKSGGWQKEIKITPDNADVLQMVEVPWAVR